MSLLFHSDHADKQTLDEAKGCDGGNLNEKCIIYASKLFMVDSRMRHGLGKLNDGDEFPR